jgi:hypothetical protein
MDELTNVSFSNNEWKALIAVYLEKVGNKEKEILYDLIQQRSTSKLPAEKPKAIKNQE